jgi:hypothetical protein
MLEVLHKSFGLLKRVDQDGYELEVVSAQGRWTSFKAGSRRLPVLWKSFGLLKHEVED